MVVHRTATVRQQEADLRDTASVYRARREKAVGDLFDELLGRDDLTPTERNGRDRADRSSGLPDQLVETAREVAASAQADQRLSANRSGRAGNEPGVTGNRRNDNRVLIVVVTRQKARQNRSCPPAARKK